MLAIEKFVGRQERIEEPVALAGVDCPPAEHQIDRGRRSSAVALAGLPKVGDSVGLQSLPPTPAGARRQSPAHGRPSHGAGASDLGIWAHRPKDHGPSVGRGPHLAAPLVQFGQPDQRHQVQLVDRQRLLEGARVPPHRRRPGGGPWRGSSTARSPTGPPPLRPGNVRLPRRACPLRAPPARARCALGDRSRSAAQGLSAQ